MELSIQYLTQNHLVPRGAYLVAFSSGSIVQVQAAGAEAAQQKAKEELVRANTANVVPTYLATVFSGAVSTVLSQQGPNLFHCVCHANVEQAVKNAVLMLQEDAAIPYVEYCVEVF